MHAHKLRQLPRRPAGATARPACDRVPEHPHVDHAGESATSTDANARDIRLRDGAGTSPGRARRSAQAPTTPVVARLRTHGAELVGEPTQYEDSYRLCYVRGPEGIIVGLAEQLS
ncbi:hypothetical protein ACFU53_29230 [Streptomyces sp. NPDC057474]|uniref:hypothetical protein n=1 Tax=Streptomyces sp. NPDC057474 TaxID=3346144 RepID=UPI0036B11700